MKIAAIQKTTLIDYPGKVACTVFLAGCSFRCPWCYSKELVLPELANVLPKISEAELLEFLEGKKDYLEGCVLCGGEPTINPGLPELIRKIKKMGYAVKLDTNGSNPGMLEGLIKSKSIDYIAMDIKLPKERYASVFASRMPMEDIERSVDILKASNMDYEFRTTVVPGFHTENDLIMMANWISSGCHGRKPKYFLQNFRAERTIDSGLEEVKPYPREFLAGICKKIAPKFSVCKVR